ncbi:PLP-dependent aminotransferase family protein [Sphingosinicella sp. CPCC 101087]|uniref:aminotransferase-like domain-containing protein n=1 Tax=Sphingosinicella sp. CPCC 101087 TaxID=2497754 RepID=UPI00101C8A85|nr:PLP-dependent aminotransferase family protein [Sphingosinicella sp. CPCC 101087]
MPDFKSIADEIAGEIAGGALRSGQKLLPLREFAYRRGIAPSTAARVYRELKRRGLTAGEIGRGTFVLNAPPRTDPPLVDPSVGLIDLELVASWPEGCEALLRSSLRRWAASPSSEAALRPISVAGTPQFREIAAAFLARAKWLPDPAKILFAGNGRQAIAAALSTLAKPGERVGIEAITYPVVKGIAERLGVTLVPLDLDEQGVSAEAAREAHQSTRLSAVYFQPTLHSPLGVSMSDLRRREWARLLTDTGIMAIEDGIYTFLAPEVLPLAALAPDQVIYVDSLSKRVSPGLTVGLLVAPRSLVQSLSVTLRAGAWSAAGASVALGCHWMNSGDAQIVMERKRADALARQALAREILGADRLCADSRALHAWLPLPEPWRGESFAAQALRRGIAVTPGEAFAVSPGYAPGAVRLALGSPGLEALGSALQTLRDMIGEGMEHHEVE